MPGPPAATPLAACITKERNHGRNHKSRRRANQVDSHPYVQDSYPAHDNRKELPNPHEGNPTSSHDHDPLWQCLGPPVIPTRPRQVRVRTNSLAMEPPLPPPPPQMRGRWPPPLSREPRCSPRFGHLPVLSWAPRDASCGGGRRPRYPRAHVHLVVVHLWLRGVTTLTSPWLGLGEGRWRKNEEEWLLDTR